MTSQVYTVRPDGSGRDAAHESRTQHRAQLVAGRQADHLRSPARRRAPSLPGSLGDGSPAARVNRPSFRPSCGRASPTGEAHETYRNPYRRARGRRRRVAEQRDDSRSKRPDRIHALPTPERPDVERDLGRQSGRDGRPQGVALTDRRPRTTRLTGRRTARGSSSTAARATGRAPCGSSGPTAATSTGSARRAPRLVPQRTARDDSGPSFAPDGRHVVFTRAWGRIKKTSLGDEIEHSAIATVDLDGKHLTILRQLAPYAGDLQSPRISPNGTLIVFDRYNSASVRPAGGDALFVTGVHGGPTRQLTPWRLSAGSPDWSPDGKRVLFKEFIPGAGELTPGTNLYTIGVDGTGLRRITNVGSRPLRPCRIVLARRCLDRLRHRRGRRSQPARHDLCRRLHDAPWRNEAVPVTRSANLDGWPSWGAQR